MESSQNMNIPFPQAAVQLHAFCRADDSNLSYVRIEIRGRRARAIATNGHYLVVVDWPLAADIPGAALHLMASELKTAAKALGKGDLSLIGVREDGVYLANASGARVPVRVEADPGYPDWEQVIPTGDGEKRIESYGINPTYVIAVMRHAADYVLPRPVKGRAQPGVSVRSDLAVDGRSPRLIEAADHARDLSARYVIMPMRM